MPPIFYNINHIILELDCSGETKEFESDKHRDLFIKLHCKKCDICRTAEEKRKRLRIPEIQEEERIVIH